ncbi:glycosyltransferase family 2 protein [bacterium (Candidatus Moisslbacteria) CG12_big_fil_rev_8_21_14_0_65_36_11]|nr:glycosyltransferase family 2 protein [Candidatus Kuenenbacteria bacterium]OIP76219.1 MAG: hypothetical protein AUK09_02580 [Parcubacteria group bacterium CG2_30_36_38]PIV46229.1 MAG: glycosyltransferase family 2 protein [bacterium (Candidatus Moisslbacteria) CG02_land_8_20_14_3_00_36_53]PIW67943.1 MAG: glycosyltransferase family 2 protein [bacterium (Candidatus Moisslbacteria) CG12_big_fil_rev_8_21_14_0_65_36_11]PIZ90245.1 MAG: glycosyltransferase family 2 protein [bacterium (Candidatus Mois
MKNNIVIVIPAYNEEKTIREVIEDAKKVTDEIIVVDDGSRDRTGEIAKSHGAQVYRHLINLGLGGALKTGFAASLKKDDFIVVTLDADGQHEASVVSKLVEPIKNGEADVVIGSRLLNENVKMPFIRLIFNHLANLITFLFYGLFVSDSQSGLRAFSRYALEKIKLKGLKMEVSSEIIGEIKRNNLSLKEIPIRAIYTDYSLSKGQNFWLGIKTFFRILIDKMT